jgi:hypothetical protein
MSPFAQTIVTPVEFYGGFTVLAGVLVVLCSYFGRTHNPEWASTVNIVGTLFIGAGTAITFLYALYSYGKPHVYQAVGAYLLFMLVIVAAGFSTIKMRRSPATPDIRCARPCTQPRDRSTDNQGKEEEHPHRGKEG